jgi:hypothetical protein
MKKILVAILFFLSPASFAMVFMQPGSQGEIIYSDTPLSNEAKPITITPTDTVAIPTEPPSTSSPIEQNQKLTPSPLDTAKKPYTAFTIISPKDQETFQNQPVIPVLIQLQPSLQVGDKLQLFLDGNPYGAPATTNQFQLNHIDRGNHQLQAILIDKNLNAIKSNLVTIFIHYGSINAPSRP